MKKLRLYLAHNFNDRAEIRKFEKAIESKYNIELFNPFYDTKRNDVRELDKLGDTRTDLRSKMQAYTLIQCRDLVERDLHEIKHSEGLFTILNHASFGTAMEIISAAYFYRIPVYIITKNYASHPWLRYMVTTSGGRMFSNKNEFKRWLKIHGYERKIKRVRE